MENIDELLKGRDLLAEAIAWLNEHGFVRATDIGRSRAEGTWVRVVGPYRDINWAFPRSTAVNRMLIYVSFVSMDGNWRALVYGCNHDYAFQDGATPLEALERLDIAIHWTTRYKELMNATSPYDL